MIKKVLKIFIFVISCLTTAAHAQAGQPKSLSKQSYTQLRKKALENDTLEAKKYIKEWIKKAKKNADYDEQVAAYKMMLYKSSNNLKLKYADSMVLVSKKTADDVLIGSSYMTKAAVYYGFQENKKALDNFILADHYIVKTKDNYARYKVKYGIAQTKYLLGFYNEAIALFNECEEYFKEENDRAYLNTLHYLGLCYNRLKKYDLATATNQLGLQEGLRLENPDMSNYFVHAEGVNQVGLENYTAAVANLSTTLPYFIKNKDFASQTIAYYYLGKSYLKLNKSEKALHYFKKVDSIFDKYRYIRPDLREGYEIVITHYKKNKDSEAQLKYVNKLLKVDTYLSQNYQYLMEKLVKEYDTPILIKSKHDLEDKMNFRTVGFLSILGLMAVVITVLVLRQIKNKKLFDKLMQNEPPISTVPKKGEEHPEEEDSQTLHEISPEIELAVVKSLEKFEQSKKYLEKEMVLSKMAALIKTNPKYLSKIILKHRGKKFIEYISDLKIDHIVALLKEESKYRNYKNKALGEEAGFGSTQNFTKAFKNRTGLSPTYFIHKLKSQ